MLRSRSPEVGLSYPQQKIPAYGVVYHRRYFQWLLRKLYQTEVKLSIPEEVKKVTLIPQNIEIPFEQIGEEYRILIPELTGHQMAVVEF